MTMRTQSSHFRSHQQSTLSSTIQWTALVSIGILTILTGIAVLIALMSPATIQSAPTIALVCVLILLCVPVPVLMLERSQRKPAARAHSITAESRVQPPRHQNPPTTETNTHNDRTRSIRPTIAHGPHDSHTAQAHQSHKNTRQTQERAKQAGM